MNMALIIGARMNQVSKNRRTLRHYNVAVQYKVIGAPSESTVNYLREIDEYMLRGCEISRRKCVSENAPTLS